MLFKEKLECFAPIVIDFSIKIQITIGWNDHFMIVFSSDFPLNICPQLISSIIFTKILWLLT